MHRVALFLALACFTGCSTVPPLPPRAAELNALGAQALAGGDLEAADARLSLALEYSPEFVEALTNLGLVELRRGNFDRAEQLFERSKRLNPNIAQTHHGLGVLSEHRHNRARASEFYRDALSVDPGFVEARANLARLLYEDQKFEHALVEFRLLFEAAPERMEGAAGLVATLIALNRLDEAHTTLEEAEARFGQVPELELLAGRWLLNSGEPKAARLRLRGVASSPSPLAVTALAWMSVCELALGNPSAAVAAAEAALSKDPDDPLAVYALAVALDDLGDSSAGAWLERALSVNPGHPELMSRLNAER